MMGDKGRLPSIYQSVSIALFIPVTNTWVFLTNSNNNNYTCCKNDDKVRILSFVLFRGELHEDRKVDQ